MNTATIRQHLHNYLDIANDKKLKAIYVMVEDELKESITEYTDELKAELDQRVAYYLDGGAMVSSAEMGQRIQAIRKKRK
ncbi:hypothetical protein [Desertivirga xinjiangensis]|uniref:hypothetical protein n=1 Tax=Desertivirga xinjiangensis TaxID=539206 RepID=UPI002108D4D4|nr:hypothetical protein [Pedobacter xinjiangensis]